MSEKLFGEYDASGNPIYETIYLGHTPVGVMKIASGATTLYNVYADQVDTPRMITKQDHTIVWRWDTAEAFGGTAPDQDPSSLGAFTFNQRFPGQVFDAETGLNQNWNREYNARLGEYIQFDPIGLAGGPNGYAYVGGNPVSLVDPKGESVTFVGALAIAGTAYGAYKTYTKFEKFNNDVKSCEAQCEISACGDPERNALFQSNQARCIAACKGSMLLQDFFGVGKGPTGPKAPMSTPNIFKP